MLYLTDAVVQETENGH